jgi:CO dehydrogenase maturation factor
MAYVIALSGKGGTGKTTIAALTIRYLVYATIGGLREESLATVRSGNERPGGMSMEQLFDYQVQQSIIESKGFDLLVMGRPEGPGCYCAANNIIRKYTDKLSEKYNYVVIDNEAGMEHLSRRTTHKVNLLLIISDPSQKGIQTARRIDSLVNDLNLEVDRRELIINRVSGEDFEKLKGAAGDLPFEKTLNVPNDDSISRFDIEGRPVFELPEESIAVKAVSSMLDSCNIP